MAVTFQQVIDRARTKLNDADKVRYADADALKDAQAGILAMLDLRPDIFFGTLGTVNVEGTYSINENVPMNGRYTLMLEDWIVHRAEFVDDEGASGTRSAAALQFFQGRLMR